MRTPFFFLFSFILAPLATGHTAPPPERVAFCAPFDYEQYRRLNPRPAGKRLTLDVGEPRTVRMIYFLPNNRPYDAAVVDTIKTLMRRAQDWFAQQMEAHGYDTRLRFEADDQGQPLVHRVDGRRSAKYYGSQNTVSKVLEEIEPVFDFEQNIYYITVDHGDYPFYNGDVSVGGTGSSWGKNGGWGMVPGWVGFGTVAHELGHAFGLRHDFRDDAYVMSYGGHERLSACNAEFLAVRPYFDLNSPPGESAPVIEARTSPRTRTAEAKSVPVQIKSSEPDGLHQAILYTRTQAPHSAEGSLEVKACRGLGGKTSSVIEFDYDGTVPSLPESDFNTFKTQWLTMSVVDVLGDAAFSEVFELINNAFRGPRSTVSGEGFIASAGFSSDGQLRALESSYEDDPSRATLWNVATGQSIGTIPWRKPIQVSAFSPDGRLLALEGPVGTIKLWDIESEQVHAAMKAAHEKGMYGGVRSLAFSPDGRRLASSGRLDSEVKLWDTESGEQIATFPAKGWGTTVSFSPDGRRLVGQYDLRVTLWDVESREEVTEIFLEHDWIYNDPGSLALSPDGRLMASGGFRQVSFSEEEEEEETEIKLWNVATGQSIATLSGNAPVAFSPDGRLLASASAQKNRIVGPADGVRFWYRSGGQAVKLWDVATGQSIAVLPPWDFVSGVAFSPDGSALAEVSWRTVRLWNVSEWAGQVTITTVEQIPHTLTKVSGEGQEGTVSEPLAKPFVVSVKDQNGSAFAGAVVTFSVTAGGGVLSATTTTTDANGRARSTLTLGDEPGTNTVTAIVEGLEPVTFTATGKATTDSDDEPQAWLTPDPAEVQFYAGDPAWKTFTVHTSLDSVLVHANPSGSDLAIEVEGGSRPPTREYCPAEGNDRPRRGRRDGWNLYVKACQAGQTKILLKDYDTGAVVQQYEVNVEASTSAAAKTALNPSYPNPFNSETVLSYTLPTAADIRLEVFTLNGQRVAVLHEGFQVAGYHTIAMDASALASGVYLYRLTTPEGRFVQKFTLLR